MINFDIIPKDAWPGVKFSHDEVLNFKFWGFGGGMRSNECPSNWYYFLHITFRDLSLLLLFLPF